MKRVLMLLIGAVIVLGAVPSLAERVDDPTPNAAFTDGEGNRGYVEVAAEDGAILRACNESETTPLGDDFTGYVWVNPNGEATPATYGNATVGAGDADGEDGGAPADGDGDTNDDCPANTDAEQP